MKSWMAVLLVTLVGAAPLMAQSMPPGYLKEMPDPARVLASFGGSDNLDRTARQKAAFIVFRDMIGELSDGRVYRHQLTADEQRISKSYEDAWGLVPTPHFDEAESRRLGWASPSGKWTKLQQDLRLDTAFRNELLDRFFSTAWKSSFLAVEARRDQKVRDFTRRQEQLASGRPTTNALSAHSTPGTWEPFLQSFVLRMSIYGYLAIVAAIAACGLAFNRLFGKSFLPGFSEEMHWVFSSEHGGRRQTSEKLGVSTATLLLTLGAAALVFWRIPLKSPLDRILAVASVPATWVALYIAWPFLIVALGVAIIALAGWGIYAYVFK